MNSKTVYIQGPFTLRHKLCHRITRIDMNHLFVFSVGNKQTGVSGASEQCRHHWILRKRCEGRCMACKKKFEKDRFNFSSSSDTKQAYRKGLNHFCDLL